jgi:sortase A
MRYRLTAGRSLHGALLHPRRRWLERGLFAVGAVCLAWCGLALAQPALYQHAAKAQIDRMISTQSVTARVASPSVAGRVVVDGELLGRINIPRLRLSAAVAEGDDDRILGVAVGHLPDTALPWQQGNAALAGHRDTFFRKLKDIHVEDEIQLMTEHGVFLYRVRRTRIVAPGDVWVLAPTAVPSLTLITCYPFSYIGHAPQRFVVQAERLPDKLPAVMPVRPDRS